MIDWMPLILLVAGLAVLIFGFGLTISEPPDVFGIPAYKGRLGGALMAVGFLVGLVGLLATAIQLAGLTA